jgi:hypothetical protein
LRLGSMGLPETTREQMRLLIADTEQKIIQMQDKVSCIRVLIVIMEWRILG